MSLVIGEGKRNNKHHFEHYVFLNGRKYLVSSLKTIDRNLETMVFRTNKNFETDYTDIFTKYHQTKDEMKCFHLYICDHLEEFINNEEEE